MITAKELKLGNLYAGRYLYEYTGHNTEFDLPEFRCIGWLHHGEFVPLSNPSVEGNCVSAWEGFRLVEAVQVEGKP